MRKILTLVLCLVSVTRMAAMSQDDFSDTRTQIFDNSFKTLKISVADDFMSPTIIALNSENQILISFDELTSDRSYLCYSIYHCNADWKPSDLLDSEYIDSFNKADVTDVAFSRTTFEQYVNYHILLPNADMQPLISGNYLVRVYREDVPEDVLLQARFSISDDIVPIEAYALTHTDRGSNGDLQQVEFNLGKRNLTNIDPYSELLISVEQNGDPYTATFTSQPLRVETDKVVYAHNTDLIFHSGNEWRRFETTRADYPGLHTDSTRYNGKRYAAWLTPDEGRADKEYLYDETQFGRYMVREYNSNDSDTGADYIDTHFTLDFPRVMNARIFIDAEFTGHILSEQYELCYNSDKHYYSAVIPLKQGSYNYRYVAVATDADGSIKGSPTPELLEGNKAETINEYCIRVYLRRHSSRADRLVGSKTIYTTL